MVTTQDAIYRGVLSDLESGLSAKIGALFIYLAVLPSFSPLAKRCVQLIPGNLSAEDPKSGTGIIKEDFSVATWNRILLDKDKMDTEKYSNSTYGVIELANTVRSTLIQGDAGGKASIPIVWIRGGKPQVSREHAGWIYVEDYFRVGYVVDWSV